jgi:hypothetical protein
LISPEFDLKSFLENNDLMGAFPRKSHDGPIRGLAIHDFHNQNRQKGGWKNNGPRELSSEPFDRGTRQSGQSSLGFNRS